MTGNLKYLYLALMTLLLGLSSCKHEDRAKQQDHYPLRDMLGRTVMVPEQVRTLVGLRAGALRLLCYLDVVDRVVGVEENEKEMTRPYNMAYPELSEKKSIGPAMGGDAEGIVSAGPDLIFITYTTVEDADALQQLTGIPVFALKTGDLTANRDTLYRSLSLAAKILGRTGRADSLIAFMESQIRQLDSLGRAAGRSPEVYCGGISYRGSHGIVSTDPHYPPFEFIGVKNVAAGLDESLVSPIAGTYIDMEQLLEWDPEYIFLDASGKSLVRKDLRDFRSSLGNLQAFQNDRVCLLFPHNWYATNHETVLVNAWLVAGQVYPGHTRIDMERKANEIYSAFLGDGVYGAMSGLYGKPGKFLQP